MPLLTKFPYNKPGHPHWEALKDIFNNERLHEYEGYDGAYYYHVMQRFCGHDEEDPPFCLLYTEKAFVAAWNKTKKQIEFYESMGLRM